MKHKEILHLLETGIPENMAKNVQKTLLTAKGRHVFTRGLIEFSNICKRNCLYCGLRAQNTSLARYTLTHEDILAAAKNAASHGADTIVLQAGEGCVNAGWLAEMVTEITEILKLPVTLSVGEHPRKNYALWKKAGAKRYLLRFETSSPELYKKLHPGYALKDRLERLFDLQSLGYETGSGFIVGLPGQSLASLARDALICKTLGLDMVGIGPFIPQKATPLARAETGSMELTLRLLSILRLLLPEANLPATTALATLDPADGQTRGLMAGANVLMPSFTPEAHSKDYTIYDAKAKVAIPCAIRSIEACGRTHSLRLP